MKKTILVIEDEPDIMRLIKYTVRKLPCEIRYAESGEQGIKMASGIPRIDVLLINVWLPGMLGSTVAAEIKVDRPGMKVILINGKDRGAVSVLQEGWNVLEKPFVGNQLLQYVTAALGLTAAAGG